MLSDARSPSTATEEPTLNSPAPAQLHLRVAPRASYSFDTPFGPGGLTVGTGDHGVVLELTPPAADQLARIICGSSTMRDVDVDEQTWITVMIDLLTCSALADGFGPAPRMVRLTGTAS